MMRWITNTYKDQSRYQRRPSDTPESHAKRLEKVLAGRIIGRPKAAPGWTVEQLEAQGYVGVYAKD